MANPLFDNWTDTADDIIDCFPIPLNYDRLIKLFTQVLLNYFNCVIELARLGNRQLSVEAVCWS